MLSRAFRPLPLFPFILLFLAFPVRELWPQATTGRILGTVKDPSGAVLSGASITLSSPDLLGGPATTLTTERGLFRFSSLPPGVYSLNVSLQGFQTYQEDGIRVELGATIERNVHLSLAELSEEVTVSAEGSGIDTRKVAVSTHFGSAEVQNLPRLRTDISDFLKMAPGISPTRPTNRYWPSVSAAGSGVSENTYLIDGADRSDPFSGRTEPFVSTDAVEEVEVVTAGASAEYGNFQGAIFNVVTRKPGNDWRFDGGYFNENQTLTDQPVKLDCACPAGETPFDNNETHDTFFQGGGPLLQDRLWLFGSYQYRQRQWSSPGADPTFPVRTREQRFLEKTSFQVTPRLRLQHTWQDGTVFWPDSPTVNYPYETLVTYEDRSPSFSFVNLSYVLDANTLLHVHFSGSFYDGEAVPNSGLTLAPRYDLATRKASGGSYIFGRFFTSRIPLQAKLSHYSEQFLRASHDFKFGVEFTSSSTSVTAGYPGGAWYTDYAGQPLYAYFIEPWVLGGQVRSLAAFAEDVVQPVERLTLHLGLRFDRNRVGSQNLPAVDRLGNETGATIKGMGTLFTWHVVSPRLGLSLKLSGDGRTALRGNWGRYYQGAFAGEFRRFHPGSTPTITAAFDPATGQYSRIISVWEPQAQQRFDPEIRAPHSDHFSIGVDREIWRQATLSVTYVRKEGRDATGWVDVGGVYGTTEVTLADGRKLKAYPLLNSTSERLYRLTNPESFYLRYRGLLVTLQKRWSHRWQALASYTLSEAVGLGIASRLAPGGDQLSVAGLSGIGRDPNDFINAEGELPNDRTHMVRVLGVTEIPKVKIAVAASFQHLSGTPWAAGAIVRLPQGARLVFIEPRGSRRLPSQTLLDLRFSKTWTINRKGKVELLVDLFNTLNDKSNERVQNTNFFAGNFAKPLTYLWPRRAMLGIKIAF